jgi:hypothetical protein
MSATIVSIGPPAFRALSSLFRSRSIRRNSDCQAPWSARFDIRAIDLSRKLFAEAFEQRSIHQVRSRASHHGGLERVDTNVQAVLASALVPLSKRVSRCLPMALLSRTAVLLHRTKSLILGAISAPGATRGVLPRSVRLLKWGTKWGKTIVSDCQPEAKPLEARAGIEPTYEDLQPDKLVPLSGRFRSADDRIGRVLK